MPTYKRTVIIEVELDDVNEGYFILDDIDSEEYDEIRINLSIIKKNMDSMMDKITKFDVENPKRMDRGEYHHRGFR